MNDRYHFERIIWKTLVFESWKRDRESRIEGEGNNNAFNEEKTSLVSNWYCLFRSSGACTRTMASSPSSFFPSLSLYLPFSASEFSLERTKRPRDIDVPSSPPSADGTRLSKKMFPGFLRGKKTLSFLIDRAFCSFHRYRCKRLWVIRRIKPPRALVFPTFSIYCTLFTLTVVLAPSDLLCRTTSANGM